MSDKTNKLFSLTGTATFVVEEGAREMGVSQSALIEMLVKNWGYQRGMLGKPGHMIVPVLDGELLDKEEELVPA